MDMTEKLTELWDQQAVQLENNRALTEKLLARQVKTEAKQALNGYRNLNIFSLVTGIILSLWCARFMYQNHETLHLLIAGSVVFIWLLFVCFGAMVQLEKQHSLDLSKPVTEVQTKLSNIRLSALMYFKYSLMILPLHLAFTLVGFKALLGVDLYTLADSSWLQTQLWFSVLLVAVCVYLFRLFSPKNIEKPIVRWFIAGMGDQATTAAEVLNELDSHDKELGGMVR